MRKNFEYQYYYILINASFSLLKNALLAFACTRRANKTNDRPRQEPIVFDEGLFNAKEP